MYRPHHYMVYELDPSYVSEDGLTHHNSYGFRGPEFDVVKRPGSTRIVCLGESTTYCVGIADDRSTWPAQFERSLRERHPGRSIEVLNAGVGAYTSAESLIQYVFRVQPLQPDVVVLYFTHTDIHPRRLPQLSRDYRESTKRWTEPPLGWLRDRLRIGRVDDTLEIGARTRRYGEYRGRGEMPSSNVRQNPPHHFRSNLRCLALLIRGWGGRILFINPQYRFLDLSPDDERVDGVAFGMQQHRAIVSEVAREFAAPVVDLRDHLPSPETARQGPDALFIDAVHVNERGATVIADRVADAITRHDLLGPRGE
jgi:lysophospholipase L1-like esterase